jgi:hypothetical protein
MTRKLSGRRKDIDLLKGSFSEKIVGLQDYYIRVSALIDGHRRAEPKNKATKQEYENNRKLLAETVFLSTYVEFEGFVTELIIGYINHNSNRFRQTIEGKIRQSVSARFGSWFNGITVFDNKPHLTTIEIAQIIDPDQRNIGFTDSKGLRQLVNDWLDDNQRVGFDSLNEIDLCIIDASKAIRNFISHKSTKSKDAMNEALQNLNRLDPDRNLGRNQTDNSKEVQTAGTYLKTIKPASVGSKEKLARVILYQRRLNEIAQKL